MQTNNSATTRRQRVWYWLPQLALLASAWVMASCTSFAPPSSAPSDVAWESVAKELAVQDWNQALELALPESIGDPRDGEVIHLLLMNRSSTEVWFPLGYGATAYLYDTSQKAWIELPNNIEYIGEEDVLEPRSSPTANWAAAVSIRPSVPRIREETVLRFVVIGKTVENVQALSQFVGGYVDLTLTP
ncbi:MAG TPA: hypothetical protein VFI11_06775 [Anaerolineales bacterium]|nr:hypothetical protein [Anaerolineales bacterium]